MSANPPRPPGPFAKLGLRLKAWRGRWRERLYRHATEVGVVMLVVLFILVYLAPNIFIFIYPGEAGVLWRRFFGGTETQAVYSEGVHIIFPWDIMYIYNARLQETGETFDVLSSDGLHMDVDITVRYRPIKHDLALLHKNIGPEYVKVLLLPEVRAHAREQIAQYTPEQLYTSQRQQVQRNVLEKIRAQLIAKYEPDTPRESYLEVDDIFIRSITLPAKVQQAIESKIAQLHAMEEYDYRLRKETKEAQRKKIEAEGIKAFQDAIKGSIDESYLKWKGIDATAQLAGSNNAKIVIIGAGQTGLPLILGGFEPPRPGAGAAPPAPLLDYPQSPPADDAPIPVVAVPQPAAGPPAGTKNP